jgi:Holliday junction resolvase
VAFERDVKRWLEGLGYFVVRSAGSRGPADHVALRAPDVRLLVQAKVDGRLPRAERLALLAAADLAGALPVLVDRPARGVRRTRLVGQDGSLPDLDLT